MSGAERVEAYRPLYEALRVARAVIEPWEYEALQALLDRLASQTPATAADRERHGFVR